MLFRMVRRAYQRSALYFLKTFANGLLSIIFKAFFNAACRMAEKLSPSRSDMVFNQAGIVRVFFTALLS